MSHFSTVKTKLRKREPLVQALQDLGLVLQEGGNIVRGYRGQSVKADLSVQTDGGGDLGFRWNEDSQSFELVADLDLWNQPVPVERFLSQLTQRYAYNTVLSATTKEGFEVSEEKNNVDGSIELVVTRWDP